jgi:putative ABC transport system permease protein
MTITLPRRAIAHRAQPVAVLEIIGMAIEALWSNRLRTGLTMLGVIIGITSVIAITSIGQGVQKATEQQIQSLGADVLQVFPSAARTGGISLARR